MTCSALQCTAVHYSALTALTDLHFNALHYTALHFNKSYYTVDSDAFLQNSNRTFQVPCCSRCISPIRCSGKATGNALHYTTLHYRECTTLNYCVHCTSTKTYLFSSTALLQYYRIYFVILIAVDPLAPFRDYK